MTFDRDMMRGAQQDQILERVAFASSHNGVVTRTARSPCRDVGNMSDDVASVVYQDLATPGKAQVLPDIAKSRLITGVETITSFH